MTTPRPQTLAGFPAALTTQDVAEVFGASEAWVDEAMRRGDLPYLRIGKRRFVGKGMLLRFLSGRLVKTERGWEEPTSLRARVAADLGGVGGGQNG